MNPTPSERTGLIEMLDWYREAVRRKVVGLTDAESRRVVSPTGVTILGLVRHLTEVEHWWWRGIFTAETTAWRFCTDDDPDRDWHVNDDDTLSEAIAAYVHGAALGNSIAASADLDDLSAGPTSVFDGRHVNLRWIFLHLIEETARHAGHLDMLRELTDGAVGD